VHLDGLVELLGLHLLQLPDRGERQLLENYAALVEEIVRAKPSASKGRYIQQITLTTTMGPGLRVDPARVRGILEEQQQEAVPA
jgi:large subunit ribosomal protein L1